MSRGVRDHRLLVEKLADGLEERPPLHLAVLAGAEGLEALEGDDGAGLVAAAVRDAAAEFSCIRCRTTSQGFHSTPAQHSARNPASTWWKAGLLSMPMPPPLPLAADEDDGVAMSESLSLAAS